MKRLKGNMKINFKRTCVLSAIIPCFAFAAEPIATPHHILVSQNPSLATTLTPTKVRLAYGFKNLLFQGEGQTIAIVAAYDNPNAEADLVRFNTTYTLPACTTANGCFKKIYATGQKPAVNTAWGLEINLAVQWVHALAPAAKILLVEAADATLPSLLKAVDVAKQNGATVINMGWGVPEFAEEVALDTNFNSANITYVSSTGNFGHGTNYPATSPYVLAVGGTILTNDALGNYIGETAWQGSGGGVSLFENIPSYQANFPIPNNTAKRGIPDVSLNADPNNAYVVYDSSGLSGWVSASGTSVASAQWAAFIALVKSGSHKSLTNLNSLIYAAAKQRYQLTFNDILTGNNGSCGYFCTAQNGYDYVTGLGSLQAPYLAYEIIYAGLKR